MNDVKISVVIKIAKDAVQLVAPVFSLMTKPKKRLGTSKIAKQINIPRMIRAKFFFFFINRNL